METNQRHSDKVTGLLADLAKAIAAMPDPKKNAKNDHFRNRYADLNAVLDCVFDPLRDNGLVLTQTMHTLPAEELGCPALETRVWHVKTGEWIASTIPLRPEKDTPQGMASAITYARRYAIKALFGLSDVDDDGNAASGRDNRAAAAPARASRGGLPEEPPHEIVDSSPTGGGLNAVLKAIAAAKDEKALLETAVEARKLPVGDQPVAKRAYAERRARLKAMVKIAAAWGDPARKQGLVDHCGVMGIMLTGLGVLDGLPTVDVIQVGDWLGEPVEAK